MHRLELDSKLLSQQVSAINLETQRVSAKITPTNRESTVSTQALTTKTRTNVIFIWVSSSDILMYAMNTTKDSI